MTFDQAQDLVNMLGMGYGLGFVFTEQDPFWFLDIDHCINADQSYTQIAHDMCALLRGAAIEISQSGTGLHLFGMGQCPPHSMKNKQIGCEFYTERRFVALTANVFESGDCRTDFTQVLPSLVSGYFPYDYNTDDSNWTTEPCEEWSGPEDDDVLINKALGSGSVTGAFGGKATFADLWHRNVPVLADNYPDQGDREYDYSSADSALAAHLSFWTGRDCERIERLMRRSALVRDKWDRRERGAGYLKTLIMKMSGAGRDVYNGGGMNTAPLPPSPSGNELEAEGRTGFQYMTPENQVDYFKGCVYIRSEHKVLVPDGDLLKPDQFKAYYGGYVFALDSTNTKTTKSAWEAFTESQAVKFPKVMDICFRPKQPSGKVIHEEGRAMVNSYVPIETRRVEGDVTPFTDFIQRILPEERDREILLTYMAALVQNIGVKFQWCPLIQSAEGLGKSIITKVMAHAMGWRYTHLPKASDLAGNGIKFNYWMANKLLIVVEEIYTADRNEVTEALKPMITDEKMELQAKGGNQHVADVPCNSLMMTNHKDAIRMTPDMRRYCVLYCKQQTANDIIESGMTGKYFRELYDWLKADGYAIVNNWLHEYELNPEFNPAGDCQRAPMTSSTAESVQIGLGAVEQEIMEAIDEGRVGFAGGWVSSFALNALLERIRATSRIPLNKRREIMRNLGYEWHPALHDGRVNNIIMQEGSTKPKLFAKQGHIINNLGSAAEVQRAYLKAQGYTVDTGVDDSVTTG